MKQAKQQLTDATQREKAAKKAAKEAANAPPEGEENKSEGKEEEKKEEPENPVNSNPVHEAVHDIKPAIVVAPGGDADSSVSEEKTDPVVEDAKPDAPVGDAKTDVPAEGAKPDTPAEGAKTATPESEKKPDDKTESPPAPDTPTEDAKMESPPAPNTPEELKKESPPEGEPDNNNNPKPDQNMIFLQEQSESHTQKLRNTKTENTKAENTKTSGDEKRDEKGDVKAVEDGEINWMKYLVATNQRKLLRLAKQMKAMQKAVGKCSRQVRVN
jgi:hypothetical protein